MKNIIKIDKYQILNTTSTTEHKTEHNYTLVNQAINIRKSNNKGVTKEIEHISNSNRQRFKGRKTQVDKSRQIHSQIKIHNKHLKNITKIDRYEKLDCTSTTEHKTEQNYTLVNEAIKIRKSNNKGVTIETEHISNSKRQTFKERKTQGRKMNKQKIQSNYNKNHYTEQNKQYKNKDNIIKDKNQLNDNKYNVGQLSTLVLDLLEVFYNTRSDNKTDKHSMHTLKIRKSNSTNINTIKQSTKRKQQISTSKLHTKKVNENIQPTTDEQTLFIPVTENQKNVKQNKSYSFKRRQNQYFSF